MCENKDFSNFLMPSENSKRFNQYHKSDQALFNHLLLMQILNI